MVKVKPVKSGTKRHQLGAIKRREKVKQNGAAKKRPKQPATTSTDHNEPPVSFDIASVKTFERLIPVSHAIALQKGWWSTGIHDRCRSEIQANFHAEISEAWEEYRADRMGTWYADSDLSLVKKPEGFWVEIADLVIRIADLFGSCQILPTVFTRRDSDGTTFESAYEDDPGLDHEPSNITHLHHLIAEEKLSEAVVFCECIASFHEIDLYGIVREKLAYNVTRPFRHGGKKA